MAGEIFLSFFFVFGLAPIEGSRVVANGATFFEIRCAAEEDRDLIRAVKAALDKNLGPEKIERSVGRKAKVNTLTREGRLILRAVDIAPDKERNETIPVLNDMKHVVYWLRPVRTRLPKIIGICWTETGHACLFFGVGLDRSGRRD